MIEQKVKKENKDPYEICQDVYFSALEKAMNLIQKN